MLYIEMKLKCLVPPDKEEEIGQELLMLMNSKGIAHVFIWASPIETKLGWEAWANAERIKLKNKK